MSTIDRTIYEQLCLFETALPTAPLKEVCALMMESEKAPNTIRAYAHCQKRFNVWCSDHGLKSIPATSETLQLFVGWCIKTGLRIQTVQLSLAAVNAAHRDVGLEPPVDDKVRQLVNSSKRKLKERSHAKAAVTLELLRRIMERFEEDEQPIARRNAAIILFAFASGFRRSEITSLDLADVTFDSRGMNIFLATSKTDQEGKGREVSIPFGKQELTCPVRALKGWLTVRGDWEGPLFSGFEGWGKKVRRTRLKGEAVCHVLKDALEATREDPARYGAHSLRAGMVTTGLENGCSVVAIMQRTGHKSVAMVERYVRPNGAFRSDPLAGVL